MIKIITTYNEKNTEEVIEYLLANKIAFERINFEEFHPYSLRLSNNNLTDNINTYWHRRGRVNFVPQTQYPERLKNYIQSEEKILIDSYEFFNKDSNYIGSYVREENHNKLIDLKVAMTAGLKIPETLCTNNKAKSFF
ncbi:hypothetical protein [Chryseobacterium indoltheticum]|uniref:hypothetical protein n=1 Tax=Chryseobacterium indoltheticum TaxID=254 RepID=UPI0040423DBD